MDAVEARELVEKCLPRFASAGLPPLTAQSIAEVKAKSIASLWAGMGSVFRLSITCNDHPPLSIIAKRVELPAVCDSIGDQRKKDSYDVEGAFYSRGHAEQLIAAGAVVPFPLHVEPRRGSGVTICMTEVEGRSSLPGAYRAFLSWLAKLHATYWGARADEACNPTGRHGGLQRQGCYWHLDTRPEEHQRMSSGGWMGRLKLAARAIDARLKQDPMQSVCHGDAKGANIVYATGRAGEVVPLVYDFQYCGKAAVAKDLAYFFNVEAGHDDEAALLAHYHTTLAKLLIAQGDTPPSLDALNTALELALCDWRRFCEIGLGGWGDAAANHRVQKVLDRLDGGEALATEEAYMEAMRAAFPV
jgi:hypothetical protein